MTPAQIRDIQTILKDAGHYDGVIDGVWGPKSRAALKQGIFTASIRKKKRLCEELLTIPVNNNKIAWGSAVSRAFSEKVIRIADRLNMGKDGPNWLMACIAFETGESFSPNVLNAAGSNAVGLIQFMPTTAEALGTSSQTLRRMSAIDQLDFVYRYFAPYSGRLKSLGDVYMAILWPLAVGKPDKYVLWDAGARPTTYRQNSGLDINNDRRITKSEAVRKVEEKLIKGLRKEYIG